MRAKRRNHMIGGLCALILISLLIVSAGAVSIDETAGLNLTFHKGAYTDLFALSQAADGGYLLGGFGYGTAGESALLIKTDADGVEGWSAAPGGDSVAALLALEDGGAVVATYTVDGGFLAVTDWENATGSSDLVGLDAAGQTLWRTTLDGVRLTDLAALPDGAIAAAGWIWIAGGESDAFLGVYEPTGAERWTATYGGRAAHTLSPSPDGSFLVAGTYRPVIETTGASWLMKADASGTKLWTKEMVNRTILTSLPVSGGGYLVGGTMTEPYGENGTMIATYAWAAAIDGDGSLAWERQVPGAEIDAMAEVPGTGYALAGRWGSAPQVQVIDYDGNVLDGLVRDAWKGRLTSVAISASGEVAASGWTGMNGSAEGWLVSFALLPDGGTPAPTGAPGFVIAGACAALVVAGFLRKTKK
ncbi:hypothetical protein [Methanofollis tationis]|uniref:PQQ-binding-like beta-propeller repeat protein n=1 Tax=Methanofollis tationis TaxID=81417 RepID=A0A7K4HME1_9EURY|nr:hypothetical protein [Methanofollis tationis]NVO66359.1 hypothetical protein [Methanofollis tationis]